MTAIQWAFICHAASNEMKDLLNVKVILRLLTVS